MKAEIIRKGSFCVIGKAGSTEDGAGFVKRLWEDANAHFDEVASLAKKDENGGFVGCWGAMSDFSMRFQPWEENFSKGMYLAGIECEDDAEAPAGWTKWMIPGFEFAVIPCKGEDPFGDGLRYLSEQGHELAGAVQEHTDLRTGQSCLCFPIRRL